MRQNTLDKVANYFFVTIFGIAGVTILGLFINCGLDVKGSYSSSHEREAGKSFLIYSKTMNLNFKTFSCTNDPKNGFVPCSYMNENNVVNYIECTGAYTFNTGCRISPK